MNKEKQQKLKELSNKYFWEQKATEIYLFILIAGLIILALYMSGSIMLMLSPEGICSTNIDTSIESCQDNLFFMGFLGLFFFAISGGFTFLIGCIIYKLIEAWIESNKEKAEQRAKKELGFKPDEWGDY